jgi:pyruvate ferredoxin oxidoreductase alpha subunit
MGSNYETAKIAADEARKSGIKAGVVCPRSFRPFPLKEVAEVLKNVKAIGAMDRSAPMGTIGALHNEIAGALNAFGYNSIITGYIYGLGGRDTTVDDNLEVFKDLAMNAEAGKRVTPLQKFIKLRGPELSFFKVGE